MKKFILIGTITIFAGIACLSFKKEKELPVVNYEGPVKELPVINNEAFKRGEMLTFRMHYGIIEAGVATLGITEEEKEIAGRKTYHVIGLGQSRGAFDLFFKVRDRYETYIDDKSIVPWIFLRHVNEGGYKIDQSYVFNHFSEKVNVGNNEMYDIEPNMQDMLSAFYAARNLDLGAAKPGETYSINCFMDKEVWPLKVKFIGRETITTDLGTFKCLKYRPIVQKGRVFKHEEDLNIWITDDKNHIPILGQADVLVGSIKAELKAYKGLAHPVAKVN
ncbi:MAG TPA: DUF3108 domain-containing protein [Bacteroidia bacterium]|nr:DUF3108 domain-containing protein [Bacteroidia bacterium]